MRSWKEAEAEAKANQQFDERGCEPKPLQIPRSTYPGVKTSGWGKPLKR